MTALRVLWFRCACGFRIKVSGPVGQDLEKYGPVYCGKCKAENQFVVEAA